MTTDDQGKENTPQERLDKIKSEEKEDASAYYSQDSSSKGNVNEEAEFSKPVPPVQQEHEEMNMLKTIAFLGFGMASLAIIFILFFVRDLDTRVMDMNGTVSSLEEKIAPLKKHVDDGFSKVNEDISGLKNKVGNYERMMAVMELKRALVTVQEMSMGNSSNVKAKSGEVVAGIEALLTALGAGPSTTQGMPAGIVSLEEAPAPAAAEEPPAHIEEPVQAEEPVLAEEPVAEEAAPAEESHAAAEPEATESAPEPVEEAPVEEESSEGGDDEEDE